MDHIDQWHDVVRIFLFWMSIVSVILLLIQIREHGNEWSVRTKDGWFALLMWSMAGVVLTMQGIVLNRPFTPGFVFIAAAILVTGKAAYTKHRKLS